MAEKTADMKKEAFLRGLYAALHALLSFRILKKILIGLIFLYKRLLSPFLPPSCRFHPSCSDYAREAIETHGVFSGVLLALKRLFRCHPFNPGGVDPVPPTFSASAPKGR